MPLDFGQGVLAEDPAFLRNVTPYYKVIKNTKDKQS